jgi:hypothetical protein
VGLNGPAMVKGGEGRKYECDRVVRDAQRVVRRECDGTGRGSRQWWTAADHAMERKRGCVNMKGGVGRGLRGHGGRGKAEAVK